MCVFILDNKHSESDMPVTSLQTFSITKHFSSEHDKRQTTKIDFNNNIYKKKKKKTSHQKEEKKKSKTDCRMKKSSYSSKNF